jgi:hypothetical protein
MEGITDRASVTTLDTPGIMPENNPLMPAQYIFVRLSHGDILWYIKHGKHTSSPRPLRLVLVFVLVHVILIICVKHLGLVQFRLCCSSKSPL